MILLLALVICSCSENKRDFDLKLDDDSIADTLSVHGFKRIEWNEEDPLIKQRTIVSFGQINEIQGQMIVEKLLYLETNDPGKEIDLYLRSLGGWLDDAFSVIDTMKEITSPVNVHALGGCGSSAFLILCSATGQRTAGPNTLLSFHSNQYKIDKTNAKINLNYNRFERLIKGHTKIGDDWLSQGRKNMHFYITPKEALKLEIIDAIRGNHASASDQDHINIP